MFKILPFLFPLLLVLSSCDKEEAADPALLAEFETNKVEIEKLELSIAEAERQIAKNRIDDATPELEALKEKVASERERKEALQKEVRALEDEKIKAAKKLSEYQQKYQVR